MRTTLLAGLALVLAPWGAVAHADSLGAEAN